MADAVGVVSVHDLQLGVKPKIALNHFLFFLFVLSSGGMVPRLDTQRADIAESDSPWEIVATWFVSSVETLLRPGLAKDYPSELRALRKICPGALPNYKWSEYADRFF